MASERGRKKVRGRERRREVNEREERSEGERRGRRVERDWRERNCSEESKKLQKKFEYHTKSSIEKREEIAE